MPETPTVLAADRLKPNDSKQAWVEQKTTRGFFPMGATDDATNRKESLYNRSASA